MDCIKSRAFAKERCGNMYMMDVPCGITTPAPALSPYNCVLAVY